MASPSVPDHGYPNQLRKPESLTDADIRRMSTQELYDMGPTVVQALGCDAFVTREAILAEYMRDVSAGYEPPLREPDAYPPGFVAGLSSDQMQTLLHLQQTQGRQAVLAARPEMTSWPPLKKPLPDVYPLGMTGDSYGLPVTICDNSDGW